MNNRLRHSGYALGTAIVAPADKRGTAPIFISVTVENAQPTKVILTYDQALLESSTPATTDFTVTSSTISSVLVSGLTVTLTLSVAVIYGDVKYVTYTAGANPIKGAVGGINAANLASTLITNNVAAEAETTALIARMVSDPTLALKRLINITIKSLKDNGIWTKLDVYYRFDLHTEQASCLNWKSSSYNVTPVNSPTWTTKVGYTGENLKYLRTGFIPSTHGVNYIARKWADGISIRNDLQNDTCYIFGGLSGSTYTVLRPRNTSNDGLVYYNSGSGLGLGGGITTSIKHYQLISLTDFKLVYYLDGIYRYVGVGTGTTNNTNERLVLCFNVGVLTPNAYAPYTISSYYMGGSMDGLGTTMYNIDKYFEDNVGGTF